MSDMPATDRVKVWDRGTRSAGDQRLVAVPDPRGALVLFGMFVLSYNVGSLLALAIFAG